MENGRVRCPRYIDSPLTFLFWDMDIFLPALVLFSVGIFSHNFFICTSICIVYMIGVSKYQRNFARGVARNFMHYIGFPYKGYPDGFIRIMRG